jgi:archaellum component FlaC
VSDALDEILEMMETLRNEYSHQDKQLNKIHATFTLLEYGYNSLRLQLSGAECSASELLTLSSSSAGSLDDHIESLESTLDDIESCVETAESVLEEIKDPIHPCGDGVWELVVDDHIESLESTLDDIESCVETAESVLEEIKDPIHPCGDGVWELVVKEDYSLAGGDTCPGDWVAVMASGRQFCGGMSVSSSASMVPFCDPATFQVGREYSKVCGRIVGYGYGSNEAVAINSVDDVEAEYVDGLSLTHGMAGSRTHVWTFAIGLAENAATVPGNACPCNPLFPAADFVPSFIGGDIFCESGLELVDGSNPAPAALHLTDPLWDGRQCQDECCNSSPYFVKTLGTSTNEQLEIRICNNANLPSQNNVVEKIEIFVQ